MPGNRAGFFSFKNMTWQELVDKAKELGQAGVAAYKDYTGAQLTAAQAQALKKTKEAPNWTVIAIVVGGVVVLVLGVVLVIRWARNR